MDLFTDDVNLISMSQNLDVEYEKDDIESLLTRAWYQRQSNTAFALQIVDKVQSELLLKVEIGADGDVWMARSLLIQAEIKWLEAELTTAEQLTKNAQSLFSVHSEYCGLSDCYLLGAWICGANGDFSNRDHHIEEAIRSAELGKDSGRVIYLKANRARLAVLRGVESSEPQWQSVNDDAHLGSPEFVSASIAAAIGTKEYVLGHYIRAIEQFEIAYRLALATGQVQSAVFAAVNVGGVYEVLNDHASSLEAIDRALETARIGNFRALLGATMTQRAETLCNMGNYADACESANEARSYYSHMQKSRNYGMMLYTSGQISLRMGDFGNALALFAKSEELARHLRQPDLLIDCLLGTAATHVATREFSTAEIAADEALHTANESGIRILQTKALRLRAKVARAQGEKHSELKHLTAAVEHAESTPGYFIPHEVLIELAEAYAADSCFDLAYASAMGAHRARKRELSEEAANRATATKIRIANERSRAEMEFQRELATTQMQRAQSLQVANETLLVLTEELHKKNKELDRLSNTDQLTGLPNRMRLDAALVQELARSQRQGCPFSVIIMDIDNFKMVNDTFGHQVGDLVLTEIARLLETSVRPYDIVGRWGGEEFLVVCSNTDLAGATVVAEKLCIAMAKHEIKVTGPRTGSFGVSAYFPGDETNTVLKRADAALYRAKESGRNRVEAG